MKSLVESQVTRQNLKKGYLKLMYRRPCSRMRNERQEILNHETSEKLQQLMRLYHVILKPLNEVDRNREFEPIKSGTSDLRFVKTMTNFGKQSYLPNQPFA